MKGQTAVALLKALTDAGAFVDCGRGTYIRAIARDLGDRLGCGGYLTELRRTRVGIHATENSVSIEQLKADGVEHHLRL